METVFWPTHSRGHCS
uniref:Uncharacterized protein n=1 Tax=Anguilla anguilla TaxID=7936 RepID=A0A0E9T9V4_ANGAN